MTLTDLRCDQARELLSPLLASELDADTAGRVHEHLDRCADCSSTFDTLRLVDDAISPFQELQPPKHLEGELTGTPCRLWLGLLFKAIDREISDANLARLLSHLDTCEACRRTWNDLSLIHQVNLAMNPPQSLVHHCISIPKQPRRRRIIGHSTAIAAAYLLALAAYLLVLLIRPPMTLAVDDMVKRMASTVSSEVSEVAETGRSEARVMLWRSWQWGQRQASAVQDLVAAVLHPSESDDSDRPAAPSDDNLDQDESDNDERGNGERDNGERDNGERGSEHDHNRPESAQHEHESNDTRSPPELGGSHE